MKTRISIETGFDTRAGIVKLSESGKEKAIDLKLVAFSRWVENCQYPTATCLRETDLPRECRKNGEMCYMAEKKKVVP